MGSSGRAALVALLLVLVSGAVAMEALSASGGIARRGTQMHLPEAGCVCHGPGVTIANQEAGQPTPDVVPFLRIEPQPAGNYTPNQVYNITVGVTRSGVEPSADARAAKMGFNLRVTEGAFVIPPGQERFLQAPEGATDELTHTRDGDVRGQNFTFQWRAPARVGDPAVFTLFVNTVNGDGLNNEEDHWNVLIVAVRGDLSLIHI